MRLGIREKGFFGFFFLHGEGGYGVGKVVDCMARGAGNLDCSSLLLLRY